MRPWQEEQEKVVSFRAELERLINRHGMENGSDTPDFILADFLAGCLHQFDRTVRWREQWYGREPAKMGGEVAPTTGDGEEVGRLRAALEEDGSE